MPWRSSWTAADPAGVRQASPSVAADVERGRGVARQPRPVRRGADTTGLHTAFEVHVAGLAQLLVGGDAVDVALPLASSGHDLGADLVEGPQPVALLVGGR